MNKHELAKIVQNLRVNKKLSWDKVAETLWSMDLVKQEDGSPYSGAGIQNYVKRITGQKYWGTRTNRTFKVDCELKLSQEEKETLFDKMQKLNFDDVGTFVANSLRAYEVLT